MDWLLILGIALASIGLAFDLQCVWLSLRRIAKKQETPSGVPIGCFCYFFAAILIAGQGAITRAAGYGTLAIGTLLLGIPLHFVCLYVIPMLITWCVSEPPRP